MRNVLRTSREGNTIRENISYIMFCCFGVFTSNPQETRDVYAEYDGGTPKFYAD